jgi:hypothetical protein
MAAARLDDAVLVVTDHHGHVLGSCFTAPVLDSSRRGTYLVASAHGLLLEASRGQPVTVVDRANQRHAAEILVCPRSAVPDIALLYVENANNRAVTCIDQPAPGTVVIRAALSGLDTRVGDLRGSYVGEESLEDHQMMVVVIDDLGPLEMPESAEHVRSVAYAGLSGMSGAPVCHSGTGGAVVGGMVVRRNTSGIANRVYALPMRAIRRYLGEHGYTLRVDHPPPTTARSSEMLMGRLIVRLLDQPGGLHQLWEETSSLFYSGEPIDVALREAVERPTRLGLEGLQLAEVEFLLARLLLKRGDERRGMAMLHRARRLSARSSTTEFRHLTALIDLRTMLHAARDLRPDERRSIFERGVGAYEQSPAATDEERAYEVASAIGSEANLMASEIGFLRRDPSAMRHYDSLLTEHSALLAGYPQLLREKQEIVNIGLSAVDALWGGDEARDPVARSHELEALAARGRLAALQRGNGIFYAQMLLADAVAARVNGHPHRAFALVCLVGTVLSSSQLTLSHEGVHSFASYINEHDRPLAHLLETTHSFDLPDARIILRDADTSPRSDKAALEAALEWCQSIEAETRKVSDIHDLESLIRGL